MRLINMVGILPKWSELCPPKTTLLTQQGGTLALDGTTTTYMHRDAGILKYTDVDEMVAAVTAPAPSALTA